MLEGKYLLLVEDNEAYGEAVATLFDEYAPQALLSWVQDLASALCAIKEINYDVIILDLLLPDARDLVALYTLVERLPNTTIIVLTAHSEHRTESLLAGARAYLLKTEAVGEALIQEIDRIVREG